MLLMSWAACRGRSRTAGVLLDNWLGEPRRWHPLVGFGRLAAALEGAFIARMFLHYGPACGQGCSAFSTMAARAGAHCSGGYVALAQ